jgi:multidrug efflux pump subunit AcrB
LAVLGLAGWGALEAVHHYPDLMTRVPEKVVRAREFFLVGGLACGLIPLLFGVAPAFERLFNLFLGIYERALIAALRWRVAVLIGLGLLLVPAFLAFRSTGQELFPEVDSSEFTVHLRASGGPRVEETERQVGQIENMIRGYEASGEDFVREVVGAARQADDGHLEALRAAHPGERELIERILRHVWDNPALRGIKKELNGRTFHIPGIVPPEDQGLMLSNVGISSRWSAVYTPNNGPHAAFIRVQLRSGFAGRHTPTLAYVDKLRARLKKRYPTHDFFFETGGMIRRILNSGALAPIEVQVFGRDSEQRRQIARLLHREVTQLAGVQDSTSPQGIDLPQFTVEVDRVRAARSGLTETDVIRNVITALMSSAQLAPNFWIDPQTGNPYIIGVQYPEYAVHDLRTLEEVPMTGARPMQGTQDGKAPANGSGGRGGPIRGRVVRLEDVADIKRGQGPVEVYHYAANRVSQLFVTVADQDLAGTASDVEGIVAHFPMTYALDQLPPEKKDLREDPAFRSRVEKYLAGHRDVQQRLAHHKGVMRKQREALRAQAEALKADYGVEAEKLMLPPGVRMEVRGEVKSMRASFADMVKIGALAVLLVYLVMAAQFASWLDPLIMIVAAPLGLIGVAFMLWATGTSLNIQSCMGVLMMVGISVSNSVLVVEFANRQRETGLGTRAAILSASCVRLRPILMTTIATLVGLAPMAIHRQPGDEMNLPLARAVIGGLAGSTLLTLFVVPILYTLLKPRREPGPVGAEGLGVRAGVFSPPLAGEAWGGAAFPPKDEG